MEFEIYDPLTLAGIINNLPEPPSRYWRDLAFPSTQQSDTSTILFDKVTNGRVLAPFVAPNVQGQPIRSRGSKTVAFNSAYVKPKHSLDPGRGVRRRPGEALGAPLSQQQRMDAILAETLQDQRDSIDRREEWMACEAVVKGTVTVVGDNYPESTVDFQRNPANTKVLTGASMWSDDTANPIAQLNSWAYEMLLRSGRRLSRVTFSPSAWQAFIANPFVQQAMETRRGSRAELETALVTGDFVVDHGLWPGNVRFVEYNEVYEDNQGNLVPYLEDGKIVLTGAIDGVIAYGAIQDARAGFQSVARFSKMWEQEDPSVIYVMTQSAPLPIPVYTDASMSVDVLG